MAEPGRDNTKKRGIMHVWMFVWRMFIAILVSCGGFGAVLAAVYGYGVICNRVDNIEMRLMSHDAYRVEADKTFNQIRQEQAEFRAEYKADMREMKTYMKIITRKLQIE